MNKQQIKGSAKEAAGKVQKNVGMATANGTQAVKGKARELAGKAEKAVGNAKQEMATKRDLKTRKEIPTKREEDLVHCRAVLSGPLYPDRFIRPALSVPGKPRHSGRSSLEAFLSAADFAADSAPDSR